MGQELVNLQGRAALRRQPLRVVAFYVLGAGLWIAASDRALGALVHDPQTLLRFSVYKGTAFVLATAALLYALLSRAFGMLEHALREVQQRELDRLRVQSLANSTIEAMPGIFYLYDTRGKFLRWNRNFERVSGYSPEEIANMQPLDFIAAEDKGRVQERIAEVFALGESSLEAAFKPKHGTPLPYFLTGKRVLLEQGECLVGVGVDIAQRKAAEDALRRSEERYRSTLSSLLEGAQLLDFDYRYLYVNEAATRHVRRDHADLLGHRLTEVWPALEHGELVAALKHALEQRKPVQGEVPFRFDDGSEAWFDVRVRPVPEGVFVLTMDISERKPAERALIGLLS